MLATSLIYLTPIPRRAGFRIVPMLISRGRVAIVTMTVFICRRLMAHRLIGQKSDNFSSAGSGPWGMPRDQSMSRDEAMALVSAETPGPSVYNRFQGMSFYDPFRWRSNLTGRYMQNLRGQGAFSLGYGIMQAGKSLAHTNVADDEALLSHPSNNQPTTGVMPGVGAIAGTLLGAAFGPGGALIGGFAGQSVGSVLEGNTGAANSRAQTGREISDELSAATGALRDFTTQIQSSGVALQSLQAGITGAGAVGTFTAGTLPGVANLTASFGQYAPQDWAAIDKYASNPYLQPSLGSRFASGAAGAGRHCGAWLRCRRAG